MFWTEAIIFELVHALNAGERELERRGSLVHSMYTLLALVVLNGARIRNTPASVFCGTKYTVAGFGLYEDWGCIAGLAMRPYPS